MREENEWQCIIELNEGSNEVINSEVNTPIVDIDDEVENEEIVVENNYTNTTQMDDINTTRLSNISRMQNKQQKETIMLGDELIVGKNHNSLDEVEFSKEEVDQLVKLVKNITKLKRLIKFSSKRQLDKLSKVSNRFYFIQW